MTETRWRERYIEVAEWIRATAPMAPPALTGFSACVDVLYRLGPPELDTLADAAAHPEDRRDQVAESAARLAHEALGRIRSGRDGEIFLPAPELAHWLQTHLGTPVSQQVGGTAAQASWALAELGASSVLALADRSAEQLGVLHPSVGVCVDGDVVPVRLVPSTGAPTKPQHFILEYTAGTRWRGHTVPRSSRIIVRLAQDGIERDAAFAAMAPMLAGKAAAGLVSGLNGVPAGDEASREWVRAVAGSWRDVSLPTIHLELAEYDEPAQLADITARHAGIVNSLGLSVTELRTLCGTDGDPSSLARTVAAHYRLDRVCVHADAWSLSVHRADPAVETAALLAGNALASARARNGAPTRDLEPDESATYETDRPRTQQLGDGWRADCVPAPYLARPAATVGLGDTFVAGTMLALSLSSTGVPAPPA